VSEFFEAEAELSGSEASSDEDEGEDDQLESEEDEEELPSEDELRMQNERHFNKQLLDEDKWNILKAQNRYLEDGDLHDEGKRKVKFSWDKANDATDWENIYAEKDCSDSDDVGEVGDVNEVVRQPTLKMFNDDDDNSNMTTTDSPVVGSNSPKIPTEVANRLKSMNAYGMMTNPKSSKGSINDFLFNDAKLKDIMSYKRTPPQIKKSNKRSKQSHGKKAHISIFDLLASHL